jgi:hypothetical protein
LSPAGLPIPAQKPFAAVEGTKSTALDERTTIRIGEHVGRRGSVIPTHYTLDSAVGASPNRETVRFAVDKIGRRA